MSKKLSGNICLIFWFIVFSFSNELLAQNSWQKRVIFFKDDRIIQAELNQAPNGFYLRNNEIAKFVSEDKIKTSVSIEFYTLTKDYSPYKASFESIYKFNASAKYQSEGSLLWKDNLAFSLKAFSLISTLAFYENARRLQSRAADSILISEYSANRADLKNAITNMEISGAIFLAVILYYAFDSYKNFATDKGGVKIYGKEPREIPLEDYLSGRFLLKNTIEDLAPGRSIYAFSYSKNF